MRMGRNRPGGGALPLGTSPLSPLPSPSPRPGEGDLVGAVVFLAGVIGPIRQIRRIGRILSRLLFLVFPPLLPVGGRAVGEEGRGDEGPPRGGGAFSPRRLFVLIRLALRMLLLLLPLLLLLLRVRLALGRTLLLDLRLGLRLAPLLDLRLALRGLALPRLRPLPAVWLGLDGRLAFRLRRGRAARLRRRLHAPLALHRGLALLGGFALRRRLDGRLAVRLRGPALGLRRWPHAALAFRRGSALLSRLTLRRRLDGGLALRLRGAALDLRSGAASGPLALGRLAALHGRLLDGGLAGTRPGRAAVRLGRRPVAGT